MEILHQRLLSRRRISATLALIVACAVAPAQLSAAKADGLADAKVEVEKAMAKPQFIAPGSAFDISKLKGKHVWIITSTMAVPFVATIAHGGEAAAKVAGIETSLFDGKGDVKKPDYIIYRWSKGAYTPLADK